MGVSAGLQALVLLLAMQHAASDSRRVEVKDLHFEGVHQIAESRLRGVLVTRPSAWLPWAENRYFDPAIFAADLKRIVAFYQDRGFPHARVLGHETQASE